MERATDNELEQVIKSAEKAVQYRMTALSISSMHINIPSALRLKITPTAPMVNKIPESAR